MLPFLLAALLAGCVPKSELVKANSDLAESQEKIKSLEQDLVSTKSALEEAESEISKLQPLADKARQLPVRTRLNHIGVGSAYTLVFRNESRVAMRFFVVITSASHAKTYNSVIEAGKIWVLPRLAAGDVVEIASEGFDTYKVSVP
jgi:outer membrane murein-binding lipoprotein Lpp